MVIKAIAGGGGRGMRIVSTGDDLEDAYARCRSEARSAFGNGDVYVEELLPRARHIEIQIVGDGSGAVSHIWERDCTIAGEHISLIAIFKHCVMETIGRRLRLLCAAEYIRGQCKHYDHSVAFRTAGMHGAAGAFDPQLEVACR